MYHFWWNICWVKYSVLRNPLFPIFIFHYINIFLGYNWKYYYQFYSGLYTSLSRIRSHFNRFSLCRRLYILDTTLLTQHFFNYGIHGCIGKCLFKGPGNVKQIIITNLPRLLLCFYCAYRTLLMLCCCCL